MRWIRDAPWTFQSDVPLHSLPNVIYVKWIPPTWLFKHYPPVAFMYAAVACGTSNRRSTANPKPSSPLSPLSFLHAVLFRSSCSFLSVSPQPFDAPRERYAEPRVPHIWPAKHGLPVPSPLSPANAPCVGCPLQILLSTLNFQLITNLTYFFKKNPQILCTFKNSL